MKWRQNRTDSKAGGAWIKFYVAREKKKKQEERNYQKNYDSAKCAGE